MNQMNFPAQITCCLAIVWSTLSAMANNSDIVLSVAPTKATFAQNEPVTLAVALRNRSSQVIEIGFDYPEDVGIVFSCTTAERSNVRRLGTKQRLLPLFIRPGESHQAVLILNRYIPIEKTGKYIVKYSAEYTEVFRGQSLPPRHFPSRGEFSFQIADGVIGQAEIDTIAEGIKSQNVQYRQEAIERLLWIKNPRVIVHLQAGARAEPRYGGDIVEALGRLLPNANARRALSEVVSGGNERCVKRFLRLSQNTQMAISEEEYRALLSSPDAEVRFVVLEHLVATGNRSNVSLVRLVAEDNNPIIKKLATEFLDKFR